MKKYSIGLLLDHPQKLSRKDWKLHYNILKDFPSQVININVKGNLFYYKRGSPPNVTRVTGNVNSFNIAKKS